MSLVVASILRHVVEGSCAVPAERGLTAAETQAADAQQHQKQRHQRAMAAMEKESALLSAFSWKGVIPEHNVAPLRVAPCRMG